MTIYLFSHFIQMKYDIYLFCFWICCATQYSVICTSGYEHWHLSFHLDEYLSPIDRDSCLLNQKKNNFSSFRKQNCSGRILCTTKFVYYDYFILQYQGPAHPQRHHHLQITSKAEPGPVPLSSFPKTYMHPPLQESV